jgi:hypothetical protein
MILSISLKIFFSASNFSKLGYLSASLPSKNHFASKNYQILVSLLISIQNPSEKADEKNVMAANKKIFSFQIYNFTTKIL